MQNDDRARAVIFRGDCPPTRSRARPRRPFARSESEGHPCSCGWTAPRRQGILELRSAGAWTWQKAYRDIEGFEY